MPLLDEVGAYLQTNGIGTLGTDMFLGFMRDEPDALTVLYETGGQAPIRAMRALPGQPVAQRPRLQIVCRDVEFEYALPRTKALAIYALLEGLGDVTLSGTRYLWVAAVSEPFQMARDDAGRVLIACNYDVIKEYS